MSTLLRRHRLHFGRNRNWAILLSIRGGCVGHLRNVGLAILGYFPSKENRAFPSRALNHDGIAIQQTNRYAPLPKKQARRPMELLLNPERINYFEDHMGDNPDWMHQYRFGDKIITGYYKLEGVPESLTWVNSRSSTADIAAMQRAYEAQNFKHRDAFFRRLCNLIPEEERSTAIDIASATGLFSLSLINNGFHRVCSSEIRTGQTDQFKLILSCLQDPKYSERISVINDPVSADDPTFPDKYHSMRANVVFSMGLLYHLENPIQHLVNLFNITDRYAVIYTMTHQNVFAQNKWGLTLENPSWITRATSGISWTPFFLAIPDLMKSIGFKSTKVVYPDIFERNFTVPKSADAKFAFKQLACIAAFRSTGIRFFSQNNFDPAYYTRLGLNPNYFAYVCEK